MNKEKNFLYKKACVELNEILNSLSEEQKSQIPENFKYNLIKNMDKNYKFSLDNSKGIFEQEIMIETEALLVEVYEKYLAPKEEKELWNKYNKICLNKIEEAKRKKYNPDDIFKKQTLKIEVNLNNNKIEAIVEYKESIFKKIKDLVKN